MIPDWTTAPDEVYLNIFLNLPARDIISSRRVCTQWRRVCEDERVKKTHSAVQLANNQVVIHYQRIIADGTRLGFGDLGPQLRGGTFQHTLTFILTNGCWQVVDSYSNDPVLPFNGLHVEGVKKWIRKLLAGEECTRLICISGIFQESFSPEQKFSTNPN